MLGEIIVILLIFNWSNIVKFRLLKMKVELRICYEETICITNKLFALDLNYIEA